MTAATAAPETTPTTASMGSTSDTGAAAAAAATAAAAPTRSPPSSSSFPAELTGTEGSTTTTTTTTTTTPLSFSSSVPSSRQVHEGDFDPNEDENENVDALGALMFTDDELLDVLRHLSMSSVDDDDDAHDDDDSNKVGLLPPSGGGVLDPGRPSSSYNINNGDDGADLVSGSIVSIANLPDLLQEMTQMESDDPNDPLTWLVDDVPWTTDGTNSIGGGDNEFVDKDQGDGDDGTGDDDIMAVFDDSDSDDHNPKIEGLTPPVLSGSASTSSTSVTSRTIRPDMFRHEEEELWGALGGATVGSADRDGSSTGATQDVLQLLDQLGDLAILDEHDAGGGILWDEYTNVGVPETASDGAEAADAAAEDGGGEASAADDDDDDDDDDVNVPLPDYLYCQPCTPQHVQEQQLLLRNLQELYGGGGVGRGRDGGGADDDSYKNNNWEDEFASRLRLANGDTNRESDDHISHSVRRRTPKLRPEAVSAVQFLLDTFDATLFDNFSSAATPPPASKPTTTTPRRERMGIGHKERILGMDGSECGRFVATASQDGTAKVWDSKSNQLLATIVHNPDHPNDHECLRVAFAPVVWGFHRLPPALAMMPMAAAVRSAASTSEFPQGSTSTTSSSPQVLDLTSRPESRYLLATGGADGRACIWSCDDPASSTTTPWTLQCVLDHAALNRYFTPESDNDTPQIYALQFVPHWRGLPTASNETQNSFLLTSSDDFVHLWEIDNRTDDDGSVMADNAEASEVATNTTRFRASVQGDGLKMREVMSIRFGNMRSSGWGVRVCSVTDDGLVVPDPSPDGENDDQNEDAVDHGETQYKFGGDRNPHHLVYVFDGRYCPSNGLLAVALSDGTLRLVNGRGVCVTLLHLPGFNSHLTSFAFDSTGTRLVTTVATGHVILWDLEVAEEPRKGGDGGGGGGDTNDDIRNQDGPSTLDGAFATCRAVLNGHEAGRPVFGAAYCGSNEDVVVSWGVDGRMCAWDSCEEGEAHGPLSVLLHKPEYPIYAVSLRYDGVAVAGGGSETSFVGVPLYLYDFDVGTAAASSTATTTGTTSI